jgi:hypothetical protein
MINLDDATFAGLVRPFISLPAGLVSLRESGPG